MNKSDPKKANDLLAKHKDDYESIGYKLIYKPTIIWISIKEYKRTLIVDEPIQRDSLSEIFLNLIADGMKSHSEISKFLGVDKDSFIFMHMDFLISHELVHQENDDYVITFDGKEFLKGKTPTHMRENRTRKFPFYYDELNERFISYCENNAIQKSKHQCFLIKGNNNAPDIKAVEFADFYSQQVKSDSVFCDFQSGKGRRLSAPTDCCAPYWMFWYKSRDDVKLELRTYHTEDRDKFSSDVESNIITEVQKFLPKLEKI